MNRKAGKHFSNSSRQQGLSLVELMVAITIGLLLIAGTVQIFLSSKQTYRMSEANSRLQENGRFATEFLAQDIRMAGFWGCSNNVAVESDLVDDGTGTYDGFTEGGIDGTNGGGTASDTIVLRGAYSTGCSVVAPFMNLPSSALHLNVGCPVDVFDILVVSDCSGADIFETTGPTDPTTSGTINHNTGNVAIGPGNATGDLSKVYAGDASIYRAAEYTYFIQANPNNEPALYRTEIGSAAAAAAAQELVEGVENLQVLYGEDTDDDLVANRYLDAASVGDMENVVSLRLALLVRSEDNVRENIDTTSTYTLAGTTVGPFNDRRLRRIFTKTVTIRNRVN